MAKTKEQKAAIIEKLEKAFKSAASTVFIHFSKVTVAEETAMRRGFRADGISYAVAKKTLIRRALDSLGLAHKDAPLEGEVSVAYDADASGDPTAVARRVWALAKQLGGEKISILGGIFEGKFVGAEGMREIATIPPLPTLRAMFAQVINSPRQRLAVVLNKVTESKN